jgi:hypothetical protein
MRQIARLSAAVGVLSSRQELGGNKHAAGCFDPVVVERRM